MKRILLIAVAVAISFSTSFACEIVFKVEKEKSSYKVGDEIIAKVTITLFHKSCNVNVKTTEFTPTNLKILQGTEWKEIEQGVWERKLKLKVTDNKDQLASLTSIRSCPKDGGKATLSLKIDK